MLAHDLCKAKVPFRVMCSVQQVTRFFITLAFQVASVRAALDRHSEGLDEALLSNAFAWIRKCTEDRFDTMVQLIQKVRHEAYRWRCFLQPILQS